MSYQEFLTQLRAELSLRIPADMHLEIRSFPRNNGTQYDGLILMRPDRNVSPTIYLMPYYHRYLEGVALEDIYEDILCCYEKHLPDEDFDTSIFTDYEKACSRIVMRLVSYRQNEALLAHVPFFRYQDLAVLFYCMLFSDSKNQANILIRNEHLTLWGITIDELDQAARANTPRLLPPELTPMRTLLQEYPSFCNPPSGTCDLSVYVLSNKYRTNGATALLYEGLISELAEQFKKDLLILPSSIHEVLLVPVDSADEVDFSYYNRLITEVNETQLADDEVLSDHAYHFCRSENRVLTPCS